MKVTGQKPDELVGALLRQRSHERQVLVGLGQGNGHAINLDADVLRCNRIVE
jgi:hypothetical protein